MQIWKRFVSVDSRFFPSRDENAQPPSSRAQINTARNYYVCTIEANRDLWMDNVATIDEVFPLAMIKYGVERQEFERIILCTFIGII